MIRHMKTRHPPTLTPICSATVTTSDSVGQVGLSISSTGQQTIASTLQRVTKYKPESERKKALDQKLLKLITSDMQPFSVVEDSGFKEFCKEIDPRYELPSRRQLKRTLTGEYTEKKEHLIQTLSKVDHFAITTDSWTSVSTERYLTVTVHYLDPSPSWKLRSAVLATRLEDARGEESAPGGTAEGMAEIIFEVLDEFAIKDKLISCTTDNASPMVNLVKSHLKVLHVRSVLGKVLEFLTRVEQ